MDTFSSFLFTHVIGGMAGWIVPVMMIAFIVGIVVRGLIYYTARAEVNFAKEFEKRAFHYFNETDLHSRELSFHRLVKALMEKTYFEVFELRRRYKRRNLDHVTTVTDRLFLIEDGVQRLMTDSLSRTRYLRRDTNGGKMTELARGAFENNPVFNRVVGVLPVTVTFELTNILPSLFVIGGIFGTFLGIAKGIPELSHMDLAQAEETKRVMDVFLSSISQAMIKSIVGIGLSVAMSIYNTIVSPETLYFNAINRFAGALDQLWNETLTNDYDRTAPLFEIPTGTAMLAPGVMVDGGPKMPGAPAVVYDHGPEPTPAAEPTPMAQHTQVSESESFVEREGSLPPSFTIDPDKKAS
jgi:hypothetical protein